MLKLRRLTTAAMRAETPLVLSALDAKHLFETSAQRVKLLDVSWFMPNIARNPRDEFTRRRLSTAQFWGLDEIAAPHSLDLKHMMPSGQQFRRACESLAIDREDHVLLYDTQGVFSSPRALFTFRAFGHESSSIINGGMPACEENNFPMEDVYPGSELAANSGTCSYPATEAPRSKIRDYEQMLSNASTPPHLSDNTELVLDARSRGRWEGTDPDPRPNLPSGHIPHSLSLPFNLLLEAKTGPCNNATYTSLLEKHKLEEVLRTTLGNAYFSQVLQGTRQVISTCGSGMTAGIIWLALRLVGVDSAIYDESWSGYAARGGSHIHREESR